MGISGNGRENPETTFIRQGLPQTPAQEEAKREVTRGKEGALGYAASPPKNPHFYAPLVQEQGH